MARKIAIILRGPPAIGKTSIKNCLLRRLGISDVSFLNLDHRSEVSRISEKERCSVLILELAYGEETCPPQPNTPLGPTRDPKSWIDSLRSQDRDVYCFLLYADWPEAQARVRNKWHGEPEVFRQRNPEECYVNAQKPYYDFYRSDGCRAFAKRAGVNEQPLDFNQSSEAAAEHIIRVCGLGT